MPLFSFDAKDDLHKLNVRLARETAQRKQREEAERRRRLAQVAKYVQDSHQAETDIARMKSQLELRMVTEMRVRQVNTATEEMERSKMVETYLGQQIAEREAREEKLRLLELCFKEARESYKATQEREKQKRLITIQNMYCKSTNKVC